MLDVFRVPSNLVLLSALVGTGAQLSLLILLIIVVAIIGMLYIGYVCFYLCLIYT
jgi:transmembrane 9 superfamily protein 3